MDSINSLYEMLDVSPLCTDDELRRAYHRMIRQHHPDVNPDKVETATTKTQQITSAYAILKKHREHGADPLDFHTQQAGTIQDIRVDFTFSIGRPKVDIEDIARRKSSFREAWQAFSQNPSDPLIALQLIHLAFRAERQDTVNDLLRNPILIDSAPLLLHNVDSESACDTLTKWADILYHNELAEKGIQILEDTFSAGQATESVKEGLRSMHYGFAQGYASGAKPAPAERIKHLKRILELGFELGYVYKLLAEAYHELGQDTQARAHLKRAYEIDPQLSGAVRISRALGFPTKDKRAPSKAGSRAKYEFTHSQQIPPPSQIREWATHGNWKEILAFAELSKYSPRIIPGSRSTIRQIAVSLGECSDPLARQALIKLLDSVYWDVRQASILSLAKIGDQDTLDSLQNFTPRNLTDEDALNQAISFLKARIEGESSVKKSRSIAELLDSARRALDTENFGQARFTLENIVTEIKQDQPVYSDVKILLARACAEMGDTGEAIHTIKPALSQLPVEARHQVLNELTSWLWNHLVFEPYDPSNDQDYLLAIKTHLDFALQSGAPDEVLSNLRYLTRWMELLGEGDMAQWIRSLIRTEAPGTVYVDSHDRKQYIREVKLSQNLRTQLDVLHGRIETGIPEKLNQVLRSAKALKGSDFSLIDGKDLLE